MKKRIISIFLTILMIFQFAMPAFADIIIDDGMITVVDDNGNIIESTPIEEWEEKYPYGIFAFKETQVNLNEDAEDGSQKGVLTVYRIGGTQGRATAKVTLTPAVVQIESDKMSYANAAGTNDYKVSVEAAWDIAQYQQYGSGEQEILPGGYLLYENGIYFEVSEEDAADFQWQIKLVDTDEGVDVSDWTDIDGADEYDLTITMDMVYYILEAGCEYDIRCLYTLDGQRYCTESWYEEIYEPDVIEIPEIPEDFVDDRSHKEYDLHFDGDEYDSYSFIVDFAEDEWEKVITFEALGDDLSETAEVINVAITEALGAEINMSACTASVAIQDDEPMIPSEMGFSELEIWADKSKGSVRIPLWRTTDGIQYVTGVDYETTDGTAEAGVDYADRKGTAVFVSDLDYTYIDIELVNDKIALAKEDSDLYFTVTLTAAKGGDSTLIEDMTEVTVYLYNTAEETDDNVATDLYSPDEEDLTGKVKDSGAIVPSGKTIYAEAVAKPENIELSYSFKEGSDTGVGTYAYDYNGARLDTYTVYGKEGYWTDKATLTNTTSSKDNYEGFGWDTKNANKAWSFKVEDTDETTDLEHKNNDNDWGLYYNSNNKLTAWHYRTQREGYMKFKTPNLHDRYTHIYLDFGAISDKHGSTAGMEDHSNTYFKFLDSDGNFAENGQGYTTIYVKNYDDRYKDLTNEELEEQDLKYLTEGKTTKAKANEYSDIMALIPITDKHTGYVFHSDFREDGITSQNAQSSTKLNGGYLQRRVVKAPIVRIHTADDDKLLENSVTEELFEFIKPKVEMVAGKGGSPFDLNKMYNNSTFQVTRNDQAGSYVYATTENKDLGNPLFYSKANISNRFDKSSSTLNYKEDGSAETGTITALHKASEESDQGYINVVMDRTQYISIEMAPSVPRKADSDDIDKNKISTAWDGLWNTNSAIKNSKITYKYKEAAWNKGKFTSFTEKSGTLSKSSFGPATTGSSLYQAKNKVKNITSICFNLEHEDRILHNGVLYYGDEEIPIAPNTFLSTHMYFTFYDKEYLSSVSTMIANITRIERYIDLNDDGVVNGYINEVGGFEPQGEVNFADDPDNATYATIPSITLDSYSVTDMSPVQDENGDYHQILLKTYYTLVPRAIDHAGVTSTAGTPAKADDTCEIVPATVTAVTEKKLVDKLSAEQKQYRYIDHGDSGSGHLMYGAEASREAFVDVPLGGDFNPGTADDEGIVTWEPDWRGNPYPGSKFEQPEPIYLDGTVLGDNYPVGELEEDENKDATGPVINLDKKEEEKNVDIGHPSTDNFGTLTQTGVSDVNNFLYSLYQNDTVALCVREELDATTYGVNLLADQPFEPLHTLKGIESTRLAFFKTFPQTAGARNLSDPVGEQGDPKENPDKNAGFDSGEAGSEMPEYNMDGTIAMPNLDIGITDFVSIALNGQEIAISAGADLFGLSKESNVEKQSKHQWKQKEVGGPIEQNAEGVNNVKQLLSTFTDKVEGDGIKKLVDDMKRDFKESMDKAKGVAGKKHGISVAGVDVNIAINVTLLLKWNPIENQFFFNKMMITLAAGIQFSYTVRLTPCPILYCTITLGFNIEVMAGLEATRVKVKGTDYNIELSSGGWTHYDGQTKMGDPDGEEAPEGKDFSVGAPGTKFSITTKEKAIDVHFSGKLSVEVKDEDGNEVDFFKKSTIKSDGEDPVTIKLAEKVDGKDNSEKYTVTFTVLNDKETRMYNKVSYTASGSTVSTLEELPTGYAIIDRIVTIDRQTHDVFFTGFNISPEIFMEVAVGIGCEIFSVELYINITIGCSFQIYSHRSEDYSGEKDEDKGFDFNEFNFIAGVGFRVSSLFFNFEFDAVQIAITYDREAKHDEHSQKNSGWNYIWYAANQPVKKYSLLNDDMPDEDVLGMKIILPGALERDETLYSSEDNAYGTDTYAFDPTDPTVPFQYSGYGTSGDAFALGSDMTSGSTYELISANGKNYIAYIVTDTTADSINQTQLVLSEVRETAVLDEFDQPTSDSTYGLAHPIGGEGDYLVLDGDGTGDLDFDVWTDADDNIHVTWVSYTSDALAAYEEALNIDEISAMATVGKHTEVKTVEIDVINETAGNVAVVSDNLAGHGMYVLPKGTTNSNGEDMIFYAETYYYEPEELEALLDEYRAYYGDITVNQDAATSMYYGEGSDPSANFRYNYKRVNLETFGKSVYPTFAVSTDTGYNVSRVTAQSWLDDGVHIDNASVITVNDTYYIAYSTSQVTLSDDEEQTIKKLYIQNVNVEDETNKAVPEGAIALRKLVDYAEDSTDDGVYEKGSLVTEYKDPYFANVQFLNGKLGELTGESEDFDDIVDMLNLTGTDTEAFLIFEMNGNTYVVPQEDLESITTEHKGRVIPFFTRETAEQISQMIEESEDIISHYEGAPVATNVTFGADGNGNITAVYTQSVPNAPGNAVYMTKYDPESMTWGIGTMLAMRDMQTFEDAEANDWSVDETVTAYYDTNNDGKLDTDDSPASFTFNKLRIGLAGTDKLLVVTEGVLMQLEAVPQMRPTFDREWNVTGIEEVTDDTDETLYAFNAKKNSNGVYDTKTGVYAVSFGMGGQSVSSAAINLRSYKLLAGEEITASVSFTNGGDVAIRASKANPATISLYAATESGAQELLTWKITETVRSGQDVKTSTETAILPSNIDVGDKLYFAVSEDVNYVTNPFTYTSLTADGEDDTPACITVADKAELGYESFSIEMIGADDDNVTLAADIHVGNRGSVSSDKTYLRFRYSKLDDDGLTTVYSPVDLRGHKLSISDQMPLSLNYDLDDMTLQNGYILLQTTENGVPVQDGAPGQIKSMHGRTVKGTFTVPKEYYDSIGTGSLNLTVTIESFVEDPENEGFYVNADEFDILNNRRLVDIEPKTLFLTVANFNAQVGSSIRLPLEIETSTKLDGAVPTVTVKEYPNDGTNNIGVLYYDVNREAIVAMPSSMGEGKIRISDHTTNSFYDICYSIDAEGVGMNIYNDNGIFKWYDKNGNTGKDIANVGENAWKFRQALTWSDDIKSAPMRSDLAIASEGEYFTFDTQANKLDLYFMGTSKSNPAEIEISSNLSGFDNITRTSSDGTVACTITIDNPGSATHTVKIKALSDEVRFDKLVEHFAADREIKSEPTAPSIFYSRSPLPERGSVKSGESVPFTVWFVDLGGIQSVLINGQNLYGETIEGEQTVEWSTALTQNTSYVFTVTDTSGNTTTRELTVDWFSNTIDETTDPGEPGFNISTGSVSGKLNLIVDPADAESSVSKFTYDKQDEPTKQFFNTYSESAATSSPYPIGGGIYRVEVTENGITGYRIIEVEKPDSNAPNVLLTLSPDGKMLNYNVSSGEGVELNKIVRIMVNNSNVAYPDSYSAAGSVEIDGFGEYVLSAIDESGKVSSCTYNLSYVSVTYDANSTEATGETPPQAIASEDAELNTCGFERIGYSFAGWSKTPDGDIITELGRPDAAYVTLYAKWDINEYTITFDTDGGNEIDAITQDYRTTVTPPADPEKTGYTFVGWDKEIPTTMPAEDMTITALWTINQYTISFDSDGGSAVASITQDYATPITPPADPEKRGYTFAGWLPEVPETMPADDIELTAQWTINKYTVTVKSDDIRMGDVDGTTTKDYMSITPITAIPNEHYVFVHWLKNDETAAYSTNNPENVTIDALDESYTAVFKLSDEYKTEQKAVAEQNADDIIKYYEDELDNLTERKKEECIDAIKDILDDAKANIDNAVYVEDVTEAHEIMDEQADMITDIAEDFTSPIYSLYAVLDFETNGGTEIPSKFKVVGAMVKLDEYVTERKGYVFTGWYADEELTERVTKIKLSKETVVYAGWEKEEAKPDPKPTVNPFKDVNKDHWFYDEVMYVYENGLMLGTSDDMFSPFMTTVRGMIVTILYRLEGEPEVDGESQFEDVAPGKYYEDAVIWAQKNGIVTGFNDAEFGPEINITREQMAAILYRYARYKGYDTSVGESTNILSYPDFDEISEYAISAIQWTCGEGIIKGRDTGDIDPTGNATRAEVATILQRFIEKFAE